MAKRVLLIGKHPIAENLIRQYEEKGIVIERQQSMSDDGISINDYEELCLLPDVGEDYKAIMMLADLGSVYELDAHDGKRLICHLLLHDNDSLQMLHTCELCKAVKQKIDVYPFTMSELWCRRIQLDYIPITLQSERHVHLVIFGMDDIAEMTTIQAAHMAHYPNYVRNHSLRTRITMIDTNAEQKSQKFIIRYQHLFNNSYYRIIKPSKEKAVAKFHKPMYEGKREDFVDVEWEFVEAEMWDAEVREKLKFWAKDDRQLLTVVMADSDEDKNAAQALCLPNELYETSTPIYIYKQQDENYDVSLPLVRMAKNVKFVYEQCYRQNDKEWSGKMLWTVEIDKEERERLWANESNVKRMSCIYNAMTIPTKMRSLGLDENDWDKFYDIPQQDIEIMAQVEHNRWSVEELLLGFRPCTDEEQEKIAADVKTQKSAYKERKIHYDLRAYKDLRPDGTGKPVQVYDLCLTSCLPLIAKASADERGGTV